MINITLVDDLKQVAKVLMGTAHAAALDVGTSARRHCVVYCQNTQVAHLIADRYPRHLKLYNVGDDHQVIFNDGVTVDGLLELFCNRNNINPTDERADQQLAVEAMVR